MVNGDQPTPGQLVGRSQLVGREQSGGRRQEYLLQSGATFVISLHGRTGLRNLAPGVLPQGLKHARGSRAAVSALLTVYFIGIVFFRYGVDSLAWPPGLRHLAIHVQRAPTGAQARGGYSSGVPSPAHASLACAGPHGDPVAPPRHRLHRHITTNDTTSTTYHHRRHYHQRHHQLTAGRRVSHIR